VFIYVLIDTVDCCTNINRQSPISVNAILKIAACKWLTLALVASTSWHLPSLRLLCESADSVTEHLVSNRPSFLTRLILRSHPEVAHLLRPSWCINIADERSSPFAGYCYNSRNRRICIRRQRAIIKIVEAWESGYRSSYMERRIDRTISLYRN